MEKPSVMSKEMLARLIGFSGTRNRVVQWHSAKLTIKPTLSIGEYVKLVRSIVRDCTGPDGEFIPELLDFSIRMNIVSAFAYVEFPDDMDRIYHYLYDSDLYDTVLKNANQGQVRAAIAAVNMQTGVGKNDF